MDTVGYVWTVTFHRQNGDLKPLGCDTTNLAGTNLEFGASCVVNTIQQGSLIAGDYALVVQYPHAYVGTPVDNTADVVPWNIDAGHLETILSSYAYFGAVTVTRESFTPTGQLRWSGGYRWTVTFTEPNGDIPLLTFVDTLEVPNLDSTMANVTFEIGGEDSPLSVDDPGTAVNGNQVSGSYGLSFTDSLGNDYVVSSDFMPVVDPLGTEAISATQYKNLLMSMLSNLDIIDVSRSSEPNHVMGYTYTVTFTGQVVGGNVQSFVPNTAELTASASSTSSWRWWWMSRCWRLPPVRNFREPSSWFSTVTPPAPWLTMLRLLL
jgi:hypothetical protein